MHSEEARREKGEGVGENSEPSGESAEESGGEESNG